MAESIRQYMIDMIERTQAQSSEEMIERGELPEKSTYEFSQFELDLVMQIRPTAILELFERSGWQMDDAGRESIAASLKERVDESEGLNVEAKVAFNKMTSLEREVIIRYRAINFSNAGGKIYEGMHLKSSDNPLNVPKFVEEYNYETLLMCVVNPSDNTGMVFNALSGQRIITSATRAKRFYLDGFLIELQDKKLKLKRHETTLESTDDSGTLYITLIGHFFNEDRLAVSVGELLADAAMSIVTENLKKKITKRFHQEDVSEEENKPETNEKYSSHLNFPKWSDGLEGYGGDFDDEDDSDNNDDDDNLIGGLYGEK